MTMTNILNIQASARLEDSTTRMLSEAALEQLAADNVVTRDLSEGINLLDSEWIAANSTPAAERTTAQRNVLRLSDNLIAEIINADTLVIGLPIYNFGVPAVMKAWIDQIARVGVTFNYTADGPVGLLENKRAIILLSSGGTKLGSEIDFASGYIKHVLSFVGITDVTIIAADALTHDADAKINEARQAIAGLV